MLLCLAQSLGDRLQAGPALTIAGEDPLKLARPDGIERLVDGRAGAPGGGSGLAGR